MKCKVAKCEKEVMYKKDQLCQMHYFRRMRTGSFDLKIKKKKYRMANPAGYQKILMPEHILSDTSGYVYEHRYVIYSIYGDLLPPCQLCGKEISWRDCHIDHIKEDVSNNEIDNLRPTCNACNTRRNLNLEQHEYNGRYSITIKGITKTPEEWSRHPDVFVTGATIRRRKAIGLSDNDAVYSRKKTHNKQIKEQLERING